MIDHALTYAARGWLVFPCYEVVDGKCSCSRGADCPRPGKHPRISNGRNGATLDEDLIRRWWGVWPNANIGIATGVESDILVVDIDDPDARQAWEFPDTVESITGSGGMHLLYQRPNGGRRYRTTTEVVPGVDSRCDGGYIIAPPSTHVQGSYVWEASSDPEDVELVPAPEWFVEQVQADPLHEGPVAMPEWDPDGDLPSTITEMLSAIPADEYTVWRDVGMAIHYHDPSDQGFKTFDWWSGTSNAYDPEGVRREWRNWSRRGHVTNQPVTLATIRRMAEAHGWTDPEVEHGAQVAANFLESRQRRIAKRLRVSVEEAGLAPPDDLVPEGLIGDVTRFIERGAHRPQPLLSLAAAISMVGVLMGRRFASPSNLRGNVYIVGLAPTGGGKDHARKTVQRLLVAAGEEDLLGGDRVASGSAIVNSLESAPEKLYLLDEFGLTLQSIAGNQAASHRRDILTVLLSLYSQASGIYLGQEYANARERPRQQIHNPHVCMYAVSTQEQFWVALQGSHVLDGTLNRMLVIDTGEGNLPPRRRDIGFEEPPPGLVERIKALANASPGRGNLIGGRAGGSLGEPPYVVPMTDEVQDAQYEFACEMDKLGTSASGRAIYSRTAEHAIKLALIHAVSLDPEEPVIGPESWAWGRDVALWCSNTLMAKAERHIASSPFEALCKKTYRYIEEAGERGRTRTQVTRYTKVRQRELNEVMESLAGQDLVATMTQESEGGRPRVVYVALDPAGGSA